MDKKLYKSTDKIVAGVCAGVAEYFGIDPTLVRLAFVLLGGLGGTGILVYVLATLIIPRSPEDFD
ncbi:PspC domain-containing protein [Bengtsoniella intestinalis]|uniref:PspC domain-containing protein n=1 Tax=Bengtsoniella intestinalis TaxID=3073143 RepID=UPI00391F5691